MSGEHSLQKVVDLAVSKGFRIKFSPKRRRARFVHKKLGINLDTEVWIDKFDGEIWVWFEINGGMSGNDPASVFLDTFRGFLRSRGAS